MNDVIFKGENHKITTDGKGTFFLYVKLADDGWRLKEKNQFTRENFKEALSNMKDMLMMEMREEEIISRLCENGFFTLSNL